MRKTIDVHKILVKERGKVEADGVYAVNSSPTADNTCWLSLKMMNIDGTADTISHGANVIIRFHGTLYDYFEG
jgi:diaminopimelate epimerase